MARNRYTLTLRLQYLLMRAIFLPVRLTPLFLALPLADFVGRFAYYLLGPYRRLALGNIRLALGDEMSERKRVRAVRASFGNVGMNVVEVIHYRAITGPHRLQEILDFSQALSLLEAHAPDSRPLFVSGHIGSWELLTSPMPDCGIPFCGVARPLPNGFVDDYLTAQRESSGLKIVKKRGALREMLKEMKRGAVLGFLVDQNARSHGVRVNFFGRPCSTIPTVASLAMKLKRPVIAAACFRTGGRPRLRVETLEPLEMVDTGDRRADLVTNTQKITDTIEELVRRAPEQWTWLHDRWRMKESWFARGRLGSSSKADSPQPTP